MIKRNNDKSRGREGTHLATAEAEAIKEDKDGKSSEDGIRRRTKYGMTVKRDGSKCIRTCNMSINGVSICFLLFINTSQAFTTSPKFERHHPLVIYFGNHYSL